MRDIRSLLDALENDQSSFGSVYRDTKGEARNEFQLPKREAMILVSGYSIKLLAKNPRTYCPCAGRS